jgi:hypothetical protein
MAEIILDFLMFPEGGKRDLPELCRADFYRTGLGELEYNEDARRLETTLFMRYWACWKCECAVE